MPGDEGPAAVAAVRSFFDDSEGEQECPSEGVCAEGGAWAEPPESVGGWSRG